MNTETTQQVPKDETNLLSKIDFKNRKFVIALVTVIVVAIAIGFIAFYRKPNNPTDNSNTTNPVLIAYQNQIPQLKSQLQGDPNNSQILKDLAIAQYATGDIEGAKATYLLVTQSVANDPVIYNNLGNIYRDSGEYQKAVDSYQKSIDLDNKQTSAYTNLANLYAYSLNEVDLSIGVYNEAIKNNPNNKETFLLQIANEYSSLGRKEDAKAVYNSILEINPNNEVAKNALKSL
ncbi:MAG: tetratricopeptide repeat protein [Candidatus Dojkabacteria bacterium]